MALREEDGWLFGDSQDDIREALKNYREDGSLAE
jgi:hypothetical protein